ncbi:hypothetical protein IC620_04855 [Hazenella sp. IB182357]|uniref:Uncharacterized protein n=1 Tax=Polycladospora coralii TaxID=2771432 RepID=A0A926RTS0_9BACL|nr:hypothetical protein [Polycladospora coralii]MBD1371687.1 hypothetical protein [Polycladospora coralii]MBS7529154.1 hypothetical protein [Polycladospora coralii]
MTKKSNRFFTRHDCIIAPELIVQLSVFRATDVKLDPKLKDLFLAK